MSTARALRTVFLWIAAVLAAQGCVVHVGADQYSEREEKRFAVSGTPDLTLATFDGSIEIRSWDQPDVRVIVERRGIDKAAAQAIEIKAEQDGNRISIEARRPRGGDTSIVGFGIQTSRSAKLIASVPRQSNILARSGDGSILIERVGGRLELRTGDGSVHGSDLRGDLRVHTGDGSVRLDDIDGPIDLETGDGSIRVSGKLTAVRARTGDGSVVIRAAEGSAMADDWNITTGDGGVTIHLPRRFDAALDAQTSDGAVNFRDIEATIDGAHDRRTLRGKIGAGGRTLRIRTGDGSIRLNGE